MINSSIDQVARVVQQTNATAEESAAASQEMSSQAVILAQLIAQFKIKAEGHSPQRRLPVRQERDKDRAAAATDTMASGGFGKY